MKLRRSLCALSLAAALAAPAASFAQEHGHEQGHGDHGQTAQSNGEHGEHGQAAGHGEGHGGGAHHGPEAINWTTFGGTRTDHAGAQKPNPPPFAATLVNFALLATILFFAVKRGINPSLATRKAAVEAEIAESQRLLAEAEATLREYTDKIERSKAEFAELRDEVVKSGRLEAEKIIEEAKAKAGRMQAEGQALIEQELRSLRADLTREVVEAAMKSAEESVKKAVGAPDQARLADSFLDGLEKAATSGRGAA